MAALKNIKTGEAFSHSRQSEKIEIDRRVDQIVKMLAVGKRRSECIQYAAETWGVSSRSTDKYLLLAREIIRKDWDVERKDFMAGIMSQLATLHDEARRKEHLHIALGALNAQARIAKLIA